MLRSRGNRQQLPSEPTDEKHGRCRSSGSLSSSSSLNYGGYPSHSGASGPMMVGIASGAAEDDYGKGNVVPSSSSRGRGGRWGGDAGNKTFGGGGGKTFGNRNAWDGHQGLVGATGPAKGNYKRGKNRIRGSLLFVLFSAAFVLTVAMGGAIFHSRRTTVQLEHMIYAMNRPSAHGQRHADNLDRFRPVEDVAEEEVKEEDAAMKVDPQEMAELRNKRSELQGESQRLSARVSSADHTAVALQIQAQIKHLQSDENPGYEKRISTTKERLKEEETRSNEFKEQFIEMHKSGAAGMGPLKKEEIENMDSIEEYEQFVMEREGALWSKIDALQEKIKRESRREAEEWFGAGPHKVALEIEYPRYTEDVEPSEWPRVRGVFTIEMAPLDLMPVAVNLFLQQIHHKLWNGCSFVFNAMHILQAGPQRRPESGYDDALMGKFAAARLDKMPFQEYSGEYPHGRHTLGFAGRPGGPDFYVNKIDNSGSHGPGGQSQHDLHEEADPCFGKLAENDTRNMKLLEELNRIPTGERSVLLSPVVIVDSRVLVDGPQGLLLELGRQQQVELRQQQVELRQQQDNETNANGNGNGNALDAVVNKGQSDENDQTTDARGGSRSNHMPAMGPGRL